MSIFKKKKEHLYKFVYKIAWPNDKRTLLVVGTDYIDATKTFYKIAGNDVRDIVEFVEIKCPEEKVANDENS
jgi:hypothetical protein